MSSSVCPPCAPLAFTDTYVADGANGLTYACCLRAGKENDTTAETLDMALRSQDSLAEKRNIWILSLECLGDFMFFAVSFLSFFRLFLPLLYMHVAPTRREKIALHCKTPCEAEHLFPVL